MFQVAEKGPKILKHPTGGVLPVETTEPMLAPLPFPAKPLPLPPAYEAAVEAVKLAAEKGAEAERNLEAAILRADKLAKEVGELSEKVKQSQPTLDRMSLSLYRREAEVEKLAAERDSLRKQCDGMAEKLANRMSGGDPFSEADTPLLRAALALAVLVDPHVQDRHRKAYLRRRGWKMDEQGWTDPATEVAGQRLVDAVALQTKRDAEGHRAALENLTTGIDAL